MSSHFVERCGQDSDLCLKEGRRWPQPTVQRGRLSLGCDHTKILAAQVDSFKGGQVRAYINQLVVARSDYEYRTQTARVTGRAEAGKLSGKPNRQNDFSKPKGGRHMPRLTHHTTSLFSLAVLLLCSSGCGNTQQKDQTAAYDTIKTEPAVEQSAVERQQPIEVSRSGDDMKAMAVVSVNHHAKQGKGPSDWDSFITWAESNNPQSVETLRRLREAGVVFFCEQDFNKASNGTSTSIFAYYPAVPEKGGDVALMDGAVQWISAKDFAEMLKVQTKFSPDNVAKKSN